MNVSVVIPVYNRVNELLRALSSVYTQHCQPDEVIVVDDGSHSDIQSPVNRHFPQAVFIKQPHHGVSRARNTGVQHSSCDWIAFLDSDDEWHPHKLNEQKKCINETKSPLCHTDEIWIRSGIRVNQHKKHKKYGGNIFSKCLPLCLISPSSVMISKQHFLDAGGFDELMPACEDYDLWLRISSKFTIAYIDKPLVTKYGGHPDQLSRKHWGMDRFRIYSMEKLFNNNSLTHEQTIDLLKQLIHKCDVFAKGAYKHHNHEAVKLYSLKSSKFKCELQKLMS